MRKKKSTVQDRSTKPFPKMADLPNRSVRSSASRAESNALYVAQISTFVEMTLRPYVFKRIPWMKGAPDPDAVADVVVPNYELLAWKVLSRSL